LNIEAQVGILQQAQEVIVIGLFAREVILEAIGLGQALVDTQYVGLDVGHGGIECGDARVQLVEDELPFILGLFFETRGQILRVGDVDRQMARQSGFPFRAVPPSRPSEAAAIWGI